MGLLHRLLLLLLLLLLTVQSVPAGCNNPVVVGTISISGNKVTRVPIILRELEFRQGDTLDSSMLSTLIEQSRRNLLKLPLFLFVTIDSGQEPLSGVVDIRIELTERWYTWIWPVFELSDRNFNSWLRNGDLSRLSFGLFFQQENFRGRMEKLNIRFKAGYQQEAMLLYEKPYLNRVRTIGAGFQLTLSRQRETGYITENDKLIYHRSGHFLLHSSDLSVFVRWRPDIHLTHSLELRYNYLSAGDSLLHLNPSYTVSGLNNSRFTELKYMLRADFRDQRAYPLKGWYGEFEVGRTGFSEKDAVHYFSGRILIRSYYRLNRDFFLASAFSGRMISEARLPYYLSGALGYKREYVRGYEYYVIDGRNYWLMKLDFKYALVRPAVKKLKWPRSGRFNTIPYSFYLGVFYDTGQALVSPVNSLNHLPGKVLGGAGLGLDFVSYYDKVFRLEITSNREGETGIFLHFMAAI